MTTRPGRPPAAHAAARTPAAPRTRTARTTGTARTAKESQP
ncbi:hypothetical protein [Streptomyces bambusae]|nr:hypothetical protein [Streptomyces bambusae]